MFAPLAEIPTNDRNFWLLVAMAGATIVLAIFRPSMRKKKDPLTRSPARNSLSQQRNVERQMESLLVELSDMARQITAQLDTRSAKLESLIQDADARITLLQNGMMEAREPVEQRSPNDAGRDAIRESGRDAIREPVREPGRSLPSGARAMLESFSTPTTSSAQSAEAMAATMAVEPMPPNPQHAQVYALADLGTLAADIARQLNRPRGEVELILALRPRGG
jgi:hypothetical protein